MHNTSLYQYLLGLQSPWTGLTLLRYDHAEERTWRHLDSCQFQKYLHARIPCVACGEHGVSR